MGVNAKHLENVKIRHHGKKELLMRHGLLRCKTCKVLWNRDENNSCNIFTISKLARNNKQRPDYLYRQQNNN